MSADTANMGGVNLITSNSDAQKIETWRLRVASRLGYDVDDRWFIATHVEIDLHALEDLIAQGCDPQMAIQILK